MLSHQVGTLIVVGGESRVLGGELCNEASEYDWSTLNYLFKFKFPVNSRALGAEFKSRETRSMRMRFNKRLHFTINKFTLCFNLFVLQ